MRIIKRAAFFCIQIFFRYFENVKIGLNVLGIFFI